jgi:predicted outer membrane repeat protein
MLQLTDNRLKYTCHASAPWWGAAAWLCVMSSTAAIAETIQVPGMHESIQAGIDAAAPGDTVLVAPGRYNEAIDLRGKAITLKASGEVEKTLIDGSSMDSSVIRCVSGEGRDTVIDGFTITSGSGDTSYYGGDSSIGGGLIVLASKPVIRNCVIRGNSVTYNGGGMYNGNGADVLVEHCTFENNSAEKGGAVFNLTSKPTFVEVAFDSNGAHYAGGGIYNANLSAASIRKCTFTLNIATFNGGAIYNYDSTPTISDCVFFNNAATYKGGAIYHGYRSGTLVEDGTSLFQTDNDDIAGGGYLLGVSHPKGACCLGGSCIEVEEGPCLKAKGVWAGANSKCSDVLAAFCPQPLAGDMNQDGAVNVDDMAILMNIWGRRGPDGRFTPR